MAGDLNRVGAHRSRSTVDKYFFTLVDLCPAEELQGGHAAHGQRCRLLVTDGIRDARHHLVFEPFREADVFRVPAGALRGGRSKDAIAFFENRDRAPGFFHLARNLHPPDILCPEPEKGKEDLLEELGDLA